MVSYPAEKLKSALIHAADAIIAAEPELTRIDTVIGDGDHGTGMKTGFKALKRELEASVYATPYELFHESGLCLVKCMGGASGVLFGTLLIGGLEEIKGLDSLNGPQLYSFLCGGIKDVQRRGKAKPGDKTMVDALLPAKAAMEQEMKASSDAIDILKAAVDGANEGVEATKNMFPHVGRSKNFREKAVGWPDPGAVSVSVLLKGLLDGLQ